jgi:2'-5' RNA ligase
MDTSTGPARLHRETSIDIWLPSVAPLVDRWRLATVEVAARGIPPHITLLYPWRPAPLRASDILEATAALAGVKPFTVTLGRLGRFPGVLFLWPEPDDQLRAIMRRLSLAFPDTPPYGGAILDPMPHLTVAKAASEAELDPLVAEVREHLGQHPPLSVTIREVVLGEEDADGRWIARASLPLGGETRIAGSPAFADCPPIPDSSS